MGEEQNAIKGRLVDTVRNHYSDTDKPLYLSRFGQLYPDIRKEALESFSSLGAAIRSVGAEFLEIVSPNNKAGGEIVVTPSNKNAVLTKFADAFADHSAAEAAFDRLPLPVRVAFCVKVEDQQQVMLSLRPRYRFERINRGSLIKDNFILVDDKYRIPGLNLNEADAEDKHNLWRNFEAWRQDNNLELSSFDNKASHDPKSDAAEIDKVIHFGALKRLVEAQTPELRGKIMIPADIALILLEFQ